MTACDPKPTLGSRYRSTPKFVGTVLDLVSKSSSPETYCRELILPKQSDNLSATIEAEAQGAKDEDLELVVPEGLYEERSL